MAKAIHTQAGGGDKANTTNPGPCNPGDDTKTPIETVSKTEFDKLLAVKDQFEKDNGELQKTNGELTKQNEEQGARIKELDEQVIAANEKVTGYEKERDGFVDNFNAEQFITSFPTIAQQIVSKFSAPAGDETVSEDEKLHASRLKVYGQGYLVVKKGNQQQIFSAIAWKNLGADKNGWQIVVTTPPEVKELQSKQ